MALPFSSLRVLASAQAGMHHYYIQFPSSLKGREKIWKKPTYCFKDPNLEVTHIASSSIGDNLAKRLPLIVKEVGCASQARRPHTQPQIITVEVGGNRFWLTASCLLHHVENKNTGRKQRGMWSFPLKWGWGSVSKEMSALLAFFELFNVSRRDYDCLGAGNKVSWLISCLTLSGCWLHAAPLTSRLTSHVC